MITPGGAQLIEIGIRVMASGNCDFGNGQFLFVAYWPEKGIQDRNDVLFGCESPHEFSAELPSRQKLVSAYARQRVGRAQPCQQAGSDRAQHVIPPHRGRAYH